MGVIGSVVHVHVLNDATAETVFGKHTFHHMDEEGVHTGLEVLVERLFHEYLRGSNALTAGIAGVAEIFVIGHLFAGKHDFVSIDDDNIVAALDEGRVARLVLATEDLCDFRAKTAEMLTGGVDENPLTVYALGVGGDGFVT